MRLSPYVASVRRVAPRVRGSGFLLCVCVRERECNVTRLNQENCRRGAAHVTRNRSSCNTHTSKVGGVSVSIRRIASAGVNNTCARADTFLNASSCTQTHTHNEKERARAHTKSFVCFRRAAAATALAVGRALACVCRPFVHKTTKIGRAHV